MLTLDIFIHLEAVDRNAWQGAADDRPLTELGSQQARRMADELSRERVDAIFSSPSLRCRASVEPLAATLSMPITVTTAGADAILAEVYAAVSNGRAVWCTTGDIVPALMTSLAEAWSIPAPPRDTRKGAVFSVRYDGASGSLALREPGAA